MLDMLVAGAAALPVRSGELVVGTGDDAAVWRAPPGDTVVSQDAIVEDVDFRRAWITPYLLGRRAFAVAVSDLAAMGATPGLCLATLCAPPATEIADVAALDAGLLDAAAAAGCAVGGGDLSAIDGPLVIDVTVVGTAAPGRALRRDAGQVGDVLAVTGRLGRAAAGLQLLRAVTERADDAVGRRWVDALLDPPTRLGEGLALVAAGARCAGDLSDGLVVDAARTAAASRCRAELWLDAVPVDPELRRRFPTRWDALALGGGEDFELLVAAPRALIDPIRGSWGRRLAPLTVVGRLVAGQGVVLLDHEGGAERPLPEVMSRHYGSGPAS